MRRRESTEELYARAEDAFTSIPEEEVKGWCKHPITQALKLSLYGDMAGHFDGWVNGAYTGPTADETIQKNSKALGSVDAIEAILIWLEDAEAGDLYD